MRRSCSVELRLRHSLCHHPLSHCDTHLHMIEIPLAKSPTLADLPAEVAPQRGKPQCIPGPTGEVRDQRAKIDLTPASPTDSDQAKKRPGRQAPKNLLRAEKRRPIEARNICRQARNDVEH